MFNIRYYGYQFYHIEKYSFFYYQLDTQQYMNRNCFDILKILLTSGLTQKL